MSRLSRLAAVAVGVGALLALAAPAGAHVTVNPSEASAGGYATVVFSVPHGCDGSPTTAIEVQIPDGVVSVKPEQKAGWNVATTIGPLAEPYDSHGTMITEGVKTVTWSGGSLPDTQYTTFGISLKLPDDEGTAAFPIVQTCATGETRWIDIPKEGEAEPEHPAPVVALAAASAEDGHGHSDETSDASETAETASAETDTAAASSDHDGSSNTLSIIALVVGGLGLIVGGAAFFTRRRVA